MKDFPFTPLYLCLSLAEIENAHPFHWSPLAFLQEQNDTLSVTPGRPERLYQYLYVPIFAWNGNPASAMVRDTGSIEFTQNLSTPHVMLTLLSVQSA